MRVHNKYKNTAPKDAVYIGRGSPYGNPFTHREGKTKAAYKVATREESIVKFKEYLDSNPALTAQVKRELKGKDLVCFCKPQSCHGDYLLIVANS